jgi:putative ubiquitin-RnfH superfamily antitoxin RatB of RatAB toxin-antitoxin module
MAHADPPLPQSITVSVFYAPADGAPDLRSVRLPAGATAMQAVQASGMFAAHPELATLDVRWGRDGRRLQPQQTVHDGDRVDLCGPLRVEPMAARRLRAAASKPRR